MTKGMPLSAAAIAVALAALAAPTAAGAQLQARVTGLADVSYGTINSFTDQTNSQNVCVHSVFRLFGFPVRRDYSVIATGSGTGGAFTLASGPRTLPYEVRWADAANQTTGTQLTAGATAAGFGNASTNQTCGGGDTASLIVTVTGSSLATASAGSYSGVLSITIVPN
jgi:type II secretory pathway pseudopilin PulG